MSRPGRRRPGRPAVVVACIVLALLLVGAGSLSYVLGARGPDSQPPAAGRRPSGPEPSPPAEVPPAGTPSEQAPVDLARWAVVTVDSQPPAIVQIGERRGNSPFTTEVEPGTVKIELSDPEGRFSKVEWLKVEPGEHQVREIRIAKVNVVFRSVPEARVFVDGRQIRGPGPDGDLTPIKESLYEGTHQVRFLCKGGKEDRQVLTVVPSSKKLEFDGRCAGQRSSRK